MQMQLHRNPGLLDYEDGTLTSSPVESAISHLQTFFFFSLENARIPSGFAERKTKNRDPPFGHVLRSFLGIKSSITAIAVIELFIPRKETKTKIETRLVGHLVNPLLVPTNLVTF
jgi:hypothetical protein